MMTHDNVKKLINNYFAEELPLETNTEIEVHLGECSECTEYLFALQNLMKNIDRLPRKIKPEKEFWEDIFNTISSIKSENIRQQEKIDSIENKKLSKQLEEELEKKNKEIIAARKTLEKEKLKSIIKDNLTKPIIRYSLIIIVLLAVAYLLYDNFLAEGKSWQVNKMKINTDYSEAFTMLPDNGFVETGNSFRLEVQVHDVGSIILGPNTKIQRLASNSIKLVKGEINVNGYIAKGFLNIQVPGGLIKDFFLGGKYRVLVSDSNTTKLEVFNSWISVSQGQVESLVLPNHTCEIFGNLVIGLPYISSSTNEFVNRIKNFCLVNSGSEENMVLLLSSANSLNLVTLWNLLKRVSPMKRDMVVYTLIDLLGEIPQGITEEGIRSLNQTMLQKLIEEIEIRI